VAPTSSNPPPQTRGPPCHRSCRLCGKFGARSADFASLPSTPARLHAPSPSALLRACPFTRPTSSSPRQVASPFLAPRPRIFDAAAKIGAPWRPTGLQRWTARATGRRRALRPQPAETAPRSDIPTPEGRILGGAGRRPRLCLYLAVLPARASELRCEPRADRGVISCTM